MRALGVLPKKQANVFVVTHVALHLSVVCERVHELAIAAHMPCKSASAATIPIQTRTLVHVNVMSFRAIILAILA